MEPDLPYRHGWHQILASSGSSLSMPGVLYGVNNAGLEGYNGLHAPLW
jgi:hypothetical protein